MLPSVLNVLNALRFIIKCALRRFECRSSLNSTLNVGNGVRTFGKFSRNSLVACSSLEVTYKGLGKDLRQNEKIYTRHSSFNHLQSTLHGPIRRCIVFLCFLLADLSVGVQTAARRPFVFFCKNPQVTSGKESLADGSRTKTFQLTNGTGPVYYTDIFFVWIILIIFNTFT